MGDKMSDVLITSKTIGKAAVPTIPKVAKAKGNVPTSEEFDKLVSSHNLLIDRLKENGTIK